MHLERVVDAYMLYKRQKLGYSYFRNEREVVRNG